jgi:hypothetical protein
MFGKLDVQAVYTHKPDNRPEWFSFPLELRVSP